MDAMNEINITVKIDPIIRFGNRLSILHVNTMNTFYAQFIYGHFPVSASDKYMRFRRIRASLGRLYD